MKKQSILESILLLLKGVIVGFGAILPAISGGTLCAAFGMYRPLIGLFSRPKESLRENWRAFAAFLSGVAIGFVGLAGLAGWLMKQNSNAVTCAFIGFILGTIPSLWQDAGKEGRGRSSYLALAVGFAAMLSVLLFLRGQNAMHLAPGIWSYLLCGVLWGLGFVVPGLSSSTLLLFFGLYEPMLRGIAQLSPGVLIPLGLGVVLCILTLPRGVNAAYQRRYAVISHAVIGIVVATTVLIFPRFDTGLGSAALYLGCIIGGAVLSCLIDRACARFAAPKSAADAVPAQNGAKEATPLVPAKSAAETAAQAPGGNGSATKAGEASAAEADVKAADAANMEDGPQRAEQGGSTK